MSSYPTKKIGIASVYYKHNYGSCLQAYATQLALQTLGYENETIDISLFSKELTKRKIRYFMKASVTSPILFHKWGLFCSRIQEKLKLNSYAKNIKKRDQAFEEFINKNFCLSEKRTLTQLSKQCEDIYSAVLVGSDQVWLPANIIADYFTLNFVPDTVKKIAYASSFGQSIFSDDIKSLSKNFLEKIDYISVREDSGKQLIKDIIGKNVPIVCDPTMLFNQETWNEIQKNERIIKGKYIFCYFIGRNCLFRSFAQRLKEKTGLKIVALTHLDEYIKEDNKYADETPYDVQPGDFLNLIKNAEYVCTDSFHGMVFSIIYEKKFFSFYRHKNNTFSTNDRVTTLLKAAEMENCLLRGEETIEYCLDIKRDFKNAHEKIDKLNEVSWTFLKNVLAEEGKAK